MNQLFTRYTKFLAVILLTLACTTRLVAFDFSASNLINTGTTENASTKAFISNKFVSEVTTLRNTLQSAYSASALTISGTVTDPACFNAYSGSIFLTVSGGTAPYSYMWSNGKTTQNNINIGAGTYTVTVTSANGLVGIKQFVLSNPPMLIAYLNCLTTCYGQCSGQATVTVTGGTPGYTYEWSGPNGFTATGVTTISNLCPGTYWVTITDAKGCKRVTSGILTENPPIVISGSVDHIKCHDECDGKIALSVSGGCPPYMYHWDNGSTSISRSNLCAGEYCVTVMDMKGCEMVKCFNINNPPALSVSINATPILCNGGSSTVSASVTGGTPDYTYLWSNGATTYTTSVGAGAVSVTVTDSKGCTKNSSTEVSQPNILTIGAQATNPLCSGATGSASASAVGGTAPYTFVWGTTPQQTGQNATGLSSGTYGVTVYDAHQCSASTTVTIIAPPALQLSLNNDPISCNGGTTVAHLSITGGTAPFNISWSTGVTSTTSNSSASLTNVSAGTLGVTVVDANNCSASKSITINQPTAVTASPQKSDVICNGACTGTASVTPSGGTAPYTIVWNNGNTNFSRTGLCAGTYSYTVKDANNCPKTGEITINQPTPLHIDITGTQPLCAGQCTGSITVTASGGTAPYSYTWSGNGCTSSNTPTKSNLCPGQYCVTVKDANNCTTSACYTITSAPALVVTLTKVNVSCFGGNNGSITLNVSGGTAPYSFTWKKSGSNAVYATSQNIGNLSAGTYSVTVKDANNCTVSKCVTICQPSKLCVSACNTNVKCFGDCNGATTISVSGGKSPYTITWANSTSHSFNRTGLCAGTYNYTVKDANGCEKPGSITITQPTQLVINISGTQPLCAGQCTGTITVSASGGTAPYSYSWSGNGCSNTNTLTKSNLCPGTYCVTVKDAKNCTASACYTINSIPALVVTLTKVDVACFGGNNGSVTLAVSGGTAPYTFTWKKSGSNAVYATSQNINNLTAGTYSVTVKDANNCTVSKCVTICQPTNLIVNSSKTDVSCFNACNGTATVAVSGGTSPYTIVWNDANTSLIRSGLCAGAYQYTVYDAHQCSKTGSVNISQPQSPISINLTAIGNCYQLANGLASISAAVSGGTAPYTFVWAGSSAFNGQGTSSITSLSAGAYNLTVTDSKGCTATASHQFQDCIPCAPSPVAINGLDEVCPSDLPAILTATAATGTPIAYLWSNGATTASISITTTGTYSVTVYFSTDDPQCIGVADKNVIVKPCCNFTDGGNLGDNFEGCGEVCPGSLGINGTVPTGGAGVIVYEWYYSTTEGGSWIAIPNSNVPNYNPGCLTSSRWFIRRAHRTPCTEWVESSVIAVIVNPIPSISASHEDATCFGVCNGTITLNVGGVTSYSVNWTKNGTAFGGNSASINGLCAGTYCYTITSDKGCTASGCETVSQPQYELSVVPTVNNVTCAGSCNGSISLAISGGNGGYIVYWSSSALSGASVSGLCAGNYGFTIIDSKGCSTDGIVTISEPEELTAQTSKVNVTCYGLCNGSASVYAVGGTEPYSYSWSNGGTNSTKGGLCAGEHCVTITDAKGCTLVKCVSISQPELLTSNASSVDVTCYGACNGSIHVSHNGGTAPYSIVWNNAANNELYDLTGLCAGTYSYTIYDKFQCSTTGSVTINQPEELTAQASKVNVTCYGLCNGSASVYAVGGTEPYSYSWSNGGTNSTKGGLCAGEHCVTITDAKGCTLVKCVSISQPELLTSNASSVDVTCYGACNGSIHVSHNGGTAPYSIVWNNASNNELYDLTGLCAGTYSYTIYDKFQCSTTGSVTINQPEELTAQASKVNVTCYGLCNGSASVYAVGGTEPYSYSWSNGGTNSTKGGLCAGEHCVTITDAKGCTLVKCVSISQPELLTSNATSVDVTCYGACNGSVSVIHDGGTAPYSIVWSNAAYNGQYNLSNVCAGTYSYTIYDKFQCSTTGTATVGSPSQLTTIPSSTNMTCNSYNLPGGCDGTAHVEISGGTAPYTIIWNNGEESTSIEHLCPGTYTYTVTDANNCTAMGQVVITEPEPFFVTSSCGCNTYILCNGDCNASINITVVGAYVPALQYLWNNGATTEDVSGLCAGQYIVTVTDSRGCIYVQYHEPFVSPEPLEIALDATAPSCNGSCDATITTTVGGGTAPYTFIWNDGATSQNRNNLCAGSYTVTVKDAHNCTAVKEITILPGEPLEVGSTQTEISCFSNCDATITINVSGGTAPYTFIWNDGATSQNRNNLCAGSYSVTVTDSHNCTAIKAHTIASVELLTSSAVSTNMTCNSLNMPGGCDGTASVTVSGGVAPYSITWSNGDGGDHIEHLCAGTYHYTVTDSRGCTSIGQVVVTEPEPFFVTSSCGCNSYIMCHDDCNASINITVVGAYVPALQYLWNNGATTEDVSGLCAGQYNVTVTDSRGCIYVQYHEPFLAPPALEVGLTNVIQDDCNTQVCDGSATVTVSGGTAPYHILWSNGTTTETANNLCANCTYSVTVMDAHMCSKTLQVAITCAPRRDSEEPMMVQVSEPQVVVYPNPMSEKASIDFIMPKDENVTLEVFNVKGEKVADLFNGQVKSGVKQSVIFSNNNYAEGVYIYRLTTSEGAYTGNIVIVR